MSHINYERIQNGMSRDQIAELLGSSGEETKTIPGFQPYVQLLGAPPGWTGVVWGETLLHWEDGDEEIWIGLSAGRVVSKYYWRPSL